MLTTLPPVPVPAVRFGLIPCIHYYADVGISYVYVLPMAYAWRNTLLGVDEGYFLFAHWKNTPFLNRCGESLRCGRVVLSLRVGQNGAHTLFVDAITGPPAFCPQACSG